MALPAPRPAQPFSEAQEPALTSGLFWARLFTYRSAFLLGGLWLVFVATSAIAYRLLMFNEPVADTTYLEAPLVVEAAPAAGDIPAPEGYATAPDTASGAASGTVLAWALFSLVGLCSFGSFVLAQQIKAASRPAKRPPQRPRQILVAAPPAAAQKAPPRPATPPQPKRLAPYVPQRDGLLAPGVVVDGGPGAAQHPPTRLASTQPTAAQTAPVSPMARRVAGPRRLPQTSAGAVPRDSAVVPVQADLPLDHPQGSVAHVLDMRQRRSLSSFM